MMMRIDPSYEDLKRLEILSELFPNIPSVCKEIINQRSILNLPKGTEHFISDLHGEYDTFYHILNNCSGVIKEKATILFSDRLGGREIEDFCTLIYYPDEKMKLMEEQNLLSDEKCYQLLTLLTELAVYITVKHTRIKVREYLPHDFGFIMEELMHAGKDELKDQQRYHEQIYRAVIETGAAKQVIKAYAEMIKKLAVDHLHIIGDMFDRGPRADKIFETLLTYPSLDIQWGNHDVLWMGAAAGNETCIATVTFMSLKYNTCSIIENGYGISLRELTTYAEKVYPTDNPLLSAKKAMCAIMAKLEGRLIYNHPEFELDHRMFLNQINYDDYTLEYEGKTYQLNKADFITVDPAAPYVFTPEEEHIIRHLKRDFCESTNLRKHIEFLYAKGSAYKIYNGNLLYHGCIPLDSYGNFAGVKLKGRIYQGKNLLDFCDLTARKAYFDHDTWSIDFMWYLWSGINSPFSGRSMKTFESIYLNDPTACVEPKNEYYARLNSERAADMILHEFGLFGKGSRIINGHTPIHASEGESPIKAEGKILVIDGGFCKAYHKKTGNAGYTLIYNSHSLLLKAHHPFMSIQEAITSNFDITSDSQIVEKFATRQHVKDTDQGKWLEERIADLELLLFCYRRGDIRQK